MGERRNEIQLPPRWPRGYPGVFQIFGRRSSFSKNGWRYKGPMRDNLVGMFFEGI